MFNYTKAQIADIAKRNSFITNTTEKVLRLYDILEYINQSDINEMLALKGGTAINLCLLDLPRLSVDIDFDFTVNCDLNKMVEYREIISKTIKDYMQDEGYLLSNRSKFTHSLDSYAYQYSTLSNSRDVIKIEINYSNRAHVLDPVVTSSSKVLDKTINIRRLANEELIGSKINALLVRTTPRDVYDVYNLINKKLISNDKLVREIALFYMCLGKEKPIDIENIVKESCIKMQKLDYNIARQTLVPVLHKKEKIVIENVAANVIDFVSSLSILDDKETQFIQEFNKNRYLPELLFGKEISNNIINHPMALWKVHNE
ncbi:MAG: nucleotidyl transferase AbiEii/AbiGii toxin family protein [Erysipelotrichaceae bacterium]|nr:nucleotidyl transferase AbiEii/AbiGii toxin family protein [Erysipelotrichaceae bacterium]